MHYTTMKQTVAMAAVMIALAISCLLIIQFKLINTGVITWDSTLGYMVSTAPLMLIGYSLIMILIKHMKWDEFYMDTDTPQVMGNEGDWKAKDVHWSSKFPK